MPVSASPSDAIAFLLSKVGQEIGVSSWRTVGQPDIDAFAAVTGDDQFIHVDPVRAAASEFGGTVAHGFLTLSLVSILAREASVRLPAATMGVNYGLDRVRFLSPVPNGKRVRGRFVLTECLPRTATAARIKYNVTVEIEGAAKPALIADWILLAEYGRAGSAAVPAQTDGGE